VKAEAGALILAGRKVPILAERDPAKLPWKALGAQVVLECTGLFTSKEKAGAHLKAGAERVIISAPGGSDVDATLCVGINLDAYDSKKHTVISNSSCTTNC
jgi:glyceraldehyde 3-phosphate dehydrogenase